MNGSGFVGGIVIATATLFLLSAAHHGATWARRDLPPASPFASAAVIRRAPYAAMATLAVAELALSMALFVNPSLGLVASTALLVVMSAILFMRPRSEPCGCFSGVLEVTSRVGAIRNVYLASAAATGTAVSFSVSPTFGSKSIAVSLVLFAPVLALGVLSKAEARA